MNRMQMIDTELLRFWLIKGITAFQLKLLVIIVEAGDERITLEDFKDGLNSFEDDEDQEIKGYSEFGESRSNIKSYIRKSLDDLEWKGIISSKGGSSKFGRKYKVSNL